MSHTGPSSPAEIGGAEDEYYENLGPGKGIYARIDQDGFVEFKINTEGTGVRGTELFERMMRAFGDRIRGVWGMWPTGINLEKVNELTAQGIPLPEAVTRTWTTHRARDFGFGEAIIHEEPMGIPGAYTKVVVRFVKERIRRDRLGRRRMNWDPLLIARLRELASRGATVKMMVDEIRGQYPDAEAIALEVDRYLTKAFFLRLRDVRNVEASACLGGKAYSDEQIDQFLLPLIAGTRHLWAVPGDEGPHAANGSTSPRVPDRWSTAGSG